MRSLVLSAVLGLVCLGFVTTTPSQAHANWLRSAYYPAYTYSSASYYYPSGYAASYYTPAYTTSFYTPTYTTTYYTPAPTYYAPVTTYYTPAAVTYYSRPVFRPRVVTYANYAPVYYYP
jgi:hypothetical protein